MIGGLQRLLRQAFMAVEGVFNRAFGDRYNPLYHLGATAFFLFWVVAVSGTYLYAFFDTAVAAAYPSVEAITHRQWFACAGSHSTACAASAGSRGCPASA